MLISDCFKYPQKMPGQTIISFDQLKDLSTLGRKVEMCLCEMLKFSHVAACASNVW